MFILCISDPKEGTGIIPTRSADMAEVGLWRVCQKRELTLTWTNLELGVRSGLYSSIQSEKFHDLKTYEKYEYMPLNPLKMISEIKTLRYNS